MPIPVTFQNFDIDNAGLTVWLFKKSGGSQGATPTFTGRWIATDEELESELKVSITEARNNITEVHDYGLLTENNESSALLIDTIETHAGVIVDNSADALANKQVSDKKHITNTNFYVVRLIDQNNILHAVRKTESSWKTKNRMGVLDIIYRDNTLELDTTPSFSLSKYFDFFIIEDDIVILNKRNFEQILSYRQAHAEEFADLQNELVFTQLFTGLDPLIDYVGTNKTHLRRICAVRQKGHYRDLGFMHRLRQHYATARLNLNFDSNGLIIPTADTCGDIITALLDHRLTSAFSQSVYDVPDAIPIH